MTKKTGPSKRGKKAPSKKEIKLHLKRHAQIRRVLARFAKDLERTSTDLSEIMGPQGGIAASTVDEIIKLMAELLAFIELSIRLCNTIYDSMGSIVDALDTPGVPADTREDLHESLGKLIDDAASFGCP